MRTGYDWDGILYYHWEKKKLSLLCLSGYFTVGVVESFPYRIWSVLHYTTNPPTIISISQSVSVQFGLWIEGINIESREFSVKHFGCEKQLLWNNKFSIKRREKYWRRKIEQTEKKKLQLIFINFLLVGLINIRCVFLDKLIIFNYPFGGHGRRAGR